MFYLLVAGSRSFSDYDLMCETLDKLLSRYTQMCVPICIVSGGARGADKLAERYAIEHDYQLEVFPADWDKFDKSAGYRRNRQMMWYISQQNRSCGCVCFWDGKSRGTALNFELAKEFNVPLRIKRFEESKGSSSPSDVMQFRDKYWFLSNFYPCKVHFGDLEFDCVEAAYQAAKCSNAEDRKRFIGLNGAESKKLGRQIKMRNDWAKVRLDVMFALVSEKFEDATLKNKLKDIEGPIVENNTWNDTFWGVCNGKGENNLGKILMEIRKASK